MSYSAMTLPVGLTRAEFLEALFGDYFAKNEGFIVIKSFKHLDHKVGARYYPNLDALCRQDFPDDHNVFFGVCPRKSMRPGPDAVFHLTALWAGLDFAPEGYSGRNSYFNMLSIAATAVRRFPLTPSIIVESGRGLHLYWLLEKAARITDVGVVEDVLNRTNRYFRCNGEVSIESALRLPGTTNCKFPSQTAACRVKYINPEIRYDFTDFQELFSSEEALPGDPQEAETPKEADAATPQPERTGPTNVKREAIRNDQADASTDVLEASVEVVEQSFSSDLVDEVAERIFFKIRDQLADHVVERIRAGLVDEIVADLVKRLREGI